jgi:hypothetical protein
MPRLRERLHDFAGALLAPAVPAPSGLTRSDGRLSARRFNVYRNNVVVGLVEAVSANYSATRRIVGDEFFAATARAYVGAHPPRTPMMFDYGADFPDFIARFEPAECVPYLSDVARLERAWLEAFHAADALPLDPAQLEAVDMTLAPDVRLTPHPSLRLVTSEHPIVTIWAMNNGDGEPGPLPAGGENALVVRPDAEVHVIPVDAGTATLVAALVVGASMLEATRSMLAAVPGSDLAESLRRLFSADAFTDLAPDRELGAGSRRSGSQ